MAIDTFKPVNQTVSEIFSVDGIYKIPNYQRQYNWNNDQLEALWDDLWEAYENQTVTNDCYFLGSIVVVNDGKGYYELIDGQQRITTLMILMNVLSKDFPHINEEDSGDIMHNADKETIDSCIMFKGKKNRLQLQTDPKYDSLFNETIIKRDTYAGLHVPTKREMRLDEPQHKYINTAVYFYNKLRSLSKDDLNKFINYIFYQTNIIRIECTNQSFAIKLFQVLNDRGLDLSPSDIVKSYIIGSFADDDEIGKQIFNNNWKNIEDMAKRYGFKIDDFIVYFEYYKLKSNPKRQVVDEMREIIKKYSTNHDIKSLVDEMHTFAEALKKVYDSNDSCILSLHYIPWKFYVMTALASAYCVDYPDKEKLFKVIRRYFYIALIAGNTLNQIKQTSFKLIESIVDLKSLDEIKDDLEQSILSKKMYQKVYEALEGDVYGEKFIKPLMLALEYEFRETTDNSFYELDNTLHIDHILPRAYKNKKEWSHIPEEAEAIINGLGNMALLQNIKNEQALNCGFDKKIQIYRGINETGKITTGVTAFNFSRKIIEDYDKGNTVWDVNTIVLRKEYLIKQIEEMLEINEDMVDVPVDVSRFLQTASSMIVTTPAKPLEKTVKLSKQERIDLLSQVEIYLKKKAKQGLLKYDGKNNSELYLRFSSNHLDEIFPHIDQLTTWGSYNLAFYEVHVEKSGVLSLNVAYFWKYMNLEEKEELKAKILDYNSRLNIAKTLFVKRYWYCWSYITKINCFDDLNNSIKDDSEIVSKLDEILMPIIEVEEKVYGQ